MLQLKIGVLISGSGTNLQSLIDNTEKGFINAEISVVISDRENAYGLERARQHDIDAVCLNRKKYNRFSKYEPCRHYSRRGFGGAGRISENTVA